jgi:hypothetical protein
MSATRLLAHGLSVACLAAAASACSGTDSGARAAGPAPTAPSASKRIGFIGLPPEGATPSAPERGELVIAYFGDAPAKIIWTTRTWGRNFAWVYTDGRLISVREDDRPYGANHISTGLLEQHLTPAGVELLRSRVIATRVLERNEVSVDSEPLGHSTIQVRRGDRLLGVVQDPASARKLAALFTDPASWLPARAWEDREFSAYVPSTFDVCYGGFPEPIEPSRILALLPAPAAELLRAEGEPLRSDPWYCSAMTTKEARVLAEALDDAGLERSGGASGLGYTLEDPGGPTRNTVSIAFAPYLPHGEAVICTACG